MNKAKEAVTRGADEARGYASGTTDSGYSSGSSGSSFGNGGNSGSGGDFEQS